MHTPQELFDTVLTAIREQGRPSMDINGRCQYRGPNGLKCAAGQLIPDEKYKPVMDSDTLNGFGRDFIKRYQLDDLEPHVDLIWYMQAAHDEAAKQFSVDFLPYFENKMAKVAGRFGLKYDS